MPQGPPAQQDERGSPHCMRVGTQEQRIQCCFIFLPSSHWRMARCQQERTPRIGWLSKGTVELSADRL
eukprot:1140266-Pelagomonas_calceolata.AAC.7